MSGPIMNSPLLDSGGNVVNVVVHDGTWTPPEGLQLGPDGGQIGDRWDGEKYLFADRYAIGSVDTSPKSQGETIIVNAPMPDDGMAERLAALEQELSDRAQELAKINEFLNTLGKNVAQNIAETPEETP